MVKAAKAIHEAELMGTPGAVGSGDRTPGAALLDFVAGTRFEELPKPALEMARLAVLDCGA